MLCAVLSGALVWALLLVPAGGADAAFTLEQVRCRSAVARSAAKLAHRAAVHTAKCHGRRDRSVPKATDGADCNRLDYGGGERVDSAEQALRSRVGGKRNRCLDASGDDLDPWHMGYRACPDPCGAPIGTADDLADCLVCLVRDAVEEMSETNLGGPAIGLCYGGSRDGLACSSCVGGSNDGSPCDDDSDCAGEGATATTARSFRSVGSAANAGMASAARPAMAVRSASTRSVTAVAATASPARSANVPMGACVNW